MAEDHPYLVVAAVLLAGVLFVAAGLGANRLLRPHVLLGVLAVGLLHAWRRGALGWQ